MLKSGLLAIFVSTAALSLSTAAADDFCASAEQSVAVQNFFVENPGAIPVIAARRLGLPEATVVSGLASGQSVSAPGSAFADIWAAMNAWQDVTFLIMKGENVFEIKSAVGEGKPSERSNYFNIEYEHPVRGHLRPDLYASIYAIEMPGETDEETNRGVIMYDQNGDSIFGVFFSGDGPDPAPAEIKKFDEVMNVVNAHPSVCPKN